MTYKQVAIQNSQRRDMTVNFIIYTESSASDVLAATEIATAAFLASPSPDGFLVMLQQALTEAGIAFTVTGVTNVAITSELTAAAPSQGYTLIAIVVAVAMVLLVVVGYIMANTGKEEDHAVSIEHLATSGGGRRGGGGGENAGTNRFLDRYPKPRSGPAPPTMGPGGQEIQMQGDGIGGSIQI